MGDAYRLDNSTNVWAPSAGALPFAYSDGEDFEHWLYQALQGVRDRSLFSEELKALIHDWPSRYHLSLERANLLRPVSDLLRGDVLELGAGCGSLTRYLGETGARVTAVEGAMPRACIAALRCADLPGVRVVCDQILSYGPDRLFDIVLLVGVAEYSPMFGSSIPELLEKVRTFLKPGGALFLATENQLGLKYFAGAYEDHIGEEFFGIMDLYQADSPVTLGRDELLSMLTGAGFTNQEFLFPFPDYKFPKAVIHQDALLEDELPVGEIICRCPSYDQHRPALRLFAEELAWRTVSRNKLLPDLSNSHVVIARLNDAPHPGCQRPLATIYSTNRSRCFIKETVIWRGPVGLRARSNRLAGGERCGNPPLQQVLGEEPFVPGAIYTADLVKIVNRRDWTADHVTDWAKDWIALARGAASGRRLPGRFVDCIPANVIRARDGRLVVIDLEWVYGDEIPLEFVLFRGLYWSLADAARSCAPPKSDLIRTIYRLAFDVLKRSGFEQSPAEQEALLRKEAAFQACVTSAESSSLFDALCSRRIVPRPDMRQLSQWASGSGAGPSEELLVQLAAVEELPQIMDRNTEGLAAHLGNLLSVKDALMLELRQELKERERVIQELQALVRAKDELLAAERSELANRQALIAKQAQMVEERDALICEQGALVKAKDELLAKQHRHVVEKDALIADQARMVEERDTLIANQARMVEERDKLIREQDALVAAKDELLRQYGLALENHDPDRASLQEGTERDR